MEHRRPQKITAFVLNQSVAVTVLGGRFGHGRGFAAIVDLAAHGLGGPGNRESRQPTVRVVHRQRSHRAQSLGQGVCDLGGVPAGPDARATDATAAAVDVDAVGNQVDVIFPIVDLVVAQEDL